MLKSIAVFTGTRAEYGLLRRVCQGLRQNSDVKMLLVVTGTHLSEQYGLTVREIEEDNMPIAAKLDILKYENDALGTAKTIAYAVDLFSDWLAKNTPDAVLVLGDRYEMFAAGIAAAALDIPIAHISGGDVTLGAKDEYYRHCLTKMAKLHFASCEEYANRVVRMGEAPQTVFNVGALGDENIRTMPLLSRDELFSSLNLKPVKEYLLVTFHPETVCEIAPQMQVNKLLKALDKCKMFCVITKANADAGGNDINQQLEEYCKAHDNAVIFGSLGVKKYLSAMKYCTAVVGNSSSGVVEAPSFGVPCVNIGNRQKGRIICNNVLCTGNSEADIISAIKKATSDEFRQIAATTNSPYNGGKTAQSIADILVQHMQNGKLAAPKTFYDGGAQ